ncbi:hypothetical protein BDZ97DRAFT_1761855 [Flammula alnicola]|nr:hypothetical protein BDZ97DRAFT_1761855 [Flammula alnicola]
MGSRRLTRIINKNRRQWGSSIAILISPLKSSYPSLGIGEFHSYRTPSSIFVAHSDGRDGTFSWGSKSVRLPSSLPFNMGDVNIWASTSVLLLRKDFSSRHLLKSLE